MRQVFLKIDGRVIDKGRELKELNRSKDSRLQLPRAGIGNERETCLCDLHRQPGLFLTCFMNMSYGLDAEGARIGLFLPERYETRTLVTGKRFYELL